jgi:exosortase
LSARAAANERTDQQHISEADGGALVRAPRTVMRILTGRTTVVVAALIAALAWLYDGVLIALVRQWGSDDNYSHGFFVVPLALFFAWERREALRTASSRPSVAGLLLVAVSLVVFIAGMFGAELFLTRVSLIGVIAGTVLFIWGREHFRILRFPICFLLLMVPLPAILFNQIAFPLQLVASGVGETVIAAAGIPVLREGNVLQLPTRALEVVEACSGIRSLVSLLMLGIVLGYFTERRPRDRALIALAAIPIAIVANAARVAGTGIASEWISPAAADGFFHTFSGWLVFVVAFAGLMAFQRVLTRFQGAGVRGQERSGVQDQAVRGQEGSAVTGPPVAVPRFRNGVSG